MSLDRPSPTELIAQAVLDAQLCALLWTLVERGVPLVAASREASAGRVLRAALAALAMPRVGTDDGGLPGGSVVAESLEDVLRLSGGAVLADSPDIGDEARDLGVVTVLKEDRHTASGFILSTAHYVRPVERDAAGHLQRRPPALLSAWDAGASRFDHFFWAITDELATRVDMDAAEFELVHRRRAALLDDLVVARVFETDHVTRHIARAALVNSRTDSADVGPPPADARH